MVVYYVVYYYSWYTRYTVILVVFWFTSGISGTFTVKCLVYVAVYCQYTGILGVVYVVLCHPAWWYAGILVVYWNAVIFVVYVVYWVVSGILVYWVVVYWYTVILVVYWWCTWYTGIRGILLGAGS